MSGGYGINGPNKKIPRPHIYVTVKKGKKKSEVLKELTDKFECDAKKYFQILREPEKKPTYTYLSNPNSGGRIVAVHTANGPNPLRPNGEIIVEEDSPTTTRATETITMFCCRNGIHYALTCFHFIWDQDFEEELRKHHPEEFIKIRDNIEFYKIRTEQEVEFFYSNGEGENATDPRGNDVFLGTFSGGHVYSKCDILSVKVSDDVAVDCQVQGIDAPDWNFIWSELQDRKVFNDDDVEVQKHGFPDQNQHKGHIHKIAHTYPCAGKLLFQDAIVIKGESGSFLKKGDSGVLVLFLDKEGRKQAFAYGVAEVDELPENEASSDEDKEAANSSDFEENGEADKNGPFVILLKLNIALKNLELSNAGCFRVCGGTGQ